MSTTKSNESMPMYLGLTIVIIILIAYFSKGSSSSEGEVSKKTGGKKKEAAASTASKKSKKGGKKSSSKKEAAKAAPAAPAEEKKKHGAVKETPVTPQVVPEVELDTTTASKKKKKSKKKPSSATSNSTTANDNVPKNNISSIPKTPALVDEDDYESDEDVDLWRLQSASKRKGANDAAKRAAANKERDRERRQKLLKEKEEKEKAEAEERARKEREEAEAVAAAQAAEEEEARQLAAKETETKAKKNGATASATTNGEATNGAGAGDKKKRKRKKKKSAEETEETVKKAPTTPAVEHWETVPIVEEWQEVGHKKAKQKAKLEANAALAEVSATEGVSDESPADEESGEISVTLAAGDDPLIFIGKGGSTIQMLQDTTGARFHLNRVTNVLTISGLEECVQQGLAEARSILATEAERKANETTEKVTWGADAIKGVIGKGGANIRATQDATGVRIDADVDAGTLTIVGPREQVSAALTMCHNAAFGEAQDVLELGSRNAVNVVYGPNFQTIRELQDSTGCKLDIDRGSTTLKLSGSNEAVADALERIRALLDENRGFEMTIENAKVGAVYGKGGETVRSIQDRTGVQIDVERGPTHATVSVMGTPEASERARIMLQRAIDGEAEVGPGEVAEEIELGSATAAVIGRGGSNVADLEKRHGVKINVRSELRVGRIVGRPEKVAAASKDILAIVKPILEAEALQKKADEAVESGESAWQVDDEVDDADGW